MKSLQLYRLFGGALGKWRLPPSDRVRMFFVKHILMQINYFDFPLPEHCKKKLMLYFISQFFQMEKESMGTGFSMLVSETKYCVPTVKCFTTKIFKITFKMKVFVIKKHLGSQFNKPQNVSCAIIQKYTTKCAVSRTFKKFKQQK